MQLFYTVVPGDTLYSISVRWKLPLDSLIASNNLISPYIIYPGQQLSVPPSVVSVRVLPGDTVYSISQRVGVSPSAIIWYNRLEPPYTIYPGQLLKIPPGIPYYIVQPGDTLYSIAGKYNVTTSGQPRVDLMQLANGLTSPGIFPGMMLVVPYAPPGGPGKIAYTSKTGGKYALWEYDPNTGSTRILAANNVESHSFPYWSPNARKIAFIGAGLIIYVLDVSTKRTARIDQVDNAYRYLDWSPDSQKLVYSKKNRIVIYNVATNRSSTISQANTSDVQFFPDGKMLLFEAPDNAGISQLFSIGTDGRDKKQLTANTDGPLHEIRLSPDGAFALYTTPGVSVSFVNTFELSTRMVYELPGGPLGKNYFPEWAPNSSLIAYNATAYGESENYYSLVQTATPRGASMKIQAVSNCYATRVSWSPDSRMLAYLSGCDSTGEAAGEMWAVDIYHPAPIRVLNNVMITNFQWSPRGA